MRKAFKLFTILVLSHALAAGAAAASPTDTVKTTVDAVIAALADASLDENAKREKVIALVSDSFNFPGMSQRILATNWKDANDAQREKFVALFTRILANTYWGRIKDYSGQSVEYVDEKIVNEKTARVRTLIVTDGQKIPVDYSLHHKDGGWVAYDVAIEGVSLVRNYRSSYQQIAKDEGIDGLLARMEEKVAEQEAGQG